MRCPGCRQLAYPYDDALQGILGAVLCAPCLADDSALHLCSVGTKQNYAAASNWWHDIKHQELPLRRQKLREPLRSGRHLSRETL